MKLYFPLVRFVAKIMAMKTMKLLKKSLILLFPVVVAVFAGWMLRTETEFFVIKDLQVEMELHEHQEALLVSLKPDIEKSLLSLRGQNIWSVSLRALRDQVVEHPWVQGIELERRFPDRIFAVVRLQPVAFLFVDKKNSIFPILENGEKLPQIKTTLAPAAPILRNNNILQDKSLLKKVLSLYSEVPLFGAFEKDNIASVDYNSVTGLTLQLIEGDIVVHLGVENIQTKALQVLRVTDYLQSQKQKARVIDASFAKKVLVRLRKRS